MPDIKECRLEIEGMDCANCAQTITKYLRQQGMDNVKVNYASGIANFFAKQNINLPDLEKGIQKLGYKVVSGKQVSKGGNINLLQVQLIVCAVLTFPLLLRMLLPIEWLQLPLTQLLFATPVFIIGLWHFGKNAFNALRLGVLHMDLLIVIGASAAYFYSLWGSIFLHDTQYLFFETSAAIITIVLLGNVLEQRAVKQTRCSLKDLQELRPDSALRINFYGLEKFEVNEEVKADDLVVDDYVLVRTGDKVPADGGIVWGTGEANEAMLTGESFPQAKSLDDKVFAGSILVKGTIKFKVLAVSEDTALSKIINLVRDTQASKPPIQRLADRITGVFVPVVLGIAVLTFLANHFVFHIVIAQSILRSIAVLVISCPCAMGLATPAAVMVGIGRAARNGVLIKDASILEKIPSIRNIVFDKTGTLTTGNFSIKKIEPFNVSEDELKSIVYSIEKYSSHPIALSLLRSLAGTQELKVKDVEEIQGIGIKGSDESGNIYVITTLQSDTGTGISVSRNNEIIGKVYIEDEIRQSSKEVIDYFNAKGIDTILLSGDKKYKVAEVSSELGMKQYFAEQLPEQKLNKINELTHQQPTMMVGDGINDAPAMARAGAGVSMSAASNITADAAQVILLNNRIELLPFTFEICRKTYQTIQQNLFWAFFYNVLAIPLAASGMLTPAVGAAAMALSDLVVLGNALRLYRRKIL